MCAAWWPTKSSRSRSNRHHDLAGLLVGFQVAMSLDDFGEGKRFVDHRLELAGG
jgi:hypothetical protein